MWANDTFRTLNELDGHSGFCSDPPNPVQRRAMDNLLQNFEVIGKPPSALSSAGAFRELCATALPYLGEDQGPTPYKKGNISLPEGGISADLGGMLPDVHSKLLSGDADIC